MSGTWKWPWKSWEKKGRPEENGWSPHLRLSSHPERCFHSSNTCFWRTGFLSVGPWLLPKEMTSLGCRDRVGQQPSEPVTSYLTKLMCASDLSLSTFGETTGSLQLTIVRGIYTIIKRPTGQWVADKVRRARFHQISGSLQSYHHPQRHGKMAYFCLEPVMSS